MSLSMCSDVFAHAESAHPLFFFLFCGTEHAKATMMSREEGRGEL